MGRFSSRVFIFQDEDSCATVDVLDACELLSVLETMEKNRNYTCHRISLICLFRKVSPCLSAVLCELLQEPLILVASLLFCEPVYDHMFRICFAMTKSEVFICCIFSCIGGDLTSVGGPPAFHSYPFLRI